MRRRPRRIFSSATERDRALQSPGWRNRRSETVGFPPPHVVEHVVVVRSSSLSEIACSQTLTHSSQTMNWWRTRAESLCYFSARLMRLSFSSFFSLNLSRPKILPMVFHSFFLPSSFFVLLLSFRIHYSCCCFWQLCFFFQSQGEQRKMLQGNWQKWGVLLPT